MYGAVKGSNEVGIMAWNIYMDDRKISLPGDLSLEERIALCEKIISENFEYFDYEIPGTTSATINSSDKVMIRLSVMGDYIYSASPSKERPTLTEHKQRKIAKNELLVDLI